MTSTERAMLLALGAIAVTIYAILGYLLTTNANDNSLSPPTAVKERITAENIAMPIVTNTPSYGRSASEPTPTPTMTLVDLASPPPLSATPTPSPTPSPPPIPTTTPTLTPSLTATESPSTVPNATLTPSPSPTHTAVPTPYGYDATWVAPWGVEAEHDYTVLDKATDAGMHWLRVQVKWEDVESAEGVYDWSTYDARFDHVVASGLLPIVTVVTNPTWADEDGNNCGPLKPDKAQAWPNFLQALVTRYGPGTGYNVRHWEIGNEIDLPYDTWLATWWPKGIGFIGCWGDTVPQYVEFLQAAAEAIRSIDPNAAIHMGSLAMLDRTNMGFVSDVLAIGGSPYFDMLGFNMYYGQDTAWYTCADPDRSPGHICLSEMGMRGKARIIHDMLTRYSVDKRVMVTETAFRCLNAYPSWAPCTPDELGAAAAYLPKAYIWALAENAHPIVWFTLDYPGFFHSSLLDQEGNLRPAYHAYRTMTHELRWARHMRPMTTEELGDDRLEGYLFQVGERKKWVLWTRGDITLLARFAVSEQPQGVLRVADLFGTEQILSDTTDSQPADGWISFEVNSNPIYVDQVP